MDILINFLAADIRMALPILIAGLGIVISERAGVVNIGCEGMMLMGSLMGVVGSYYSESALVGALAAMLSGVVVAGLFALFSIGFYANQNVIGIAINTLALGFTTTMNRVIFGVDAGVKKIAGFDVIAVPVLSQIPFLGEIVFNQSVLWYAAVFLVAGSYFVLYHTAIGLKIRAVGENPKACLTVGIKVNKLRVATIIYSGLLSGLAGAYVSMGQVSFFTEDMVAGRGYMALAAVVFGRYNPLGVFGACLLFGIGDSLKYLLSGMGINVAHQWLSMLPYMITIIALCGLIGKSNKPAASGILYKDEK